MPVGLVPEPVLRVNSGLEGLAVGQRGGRDTVGVGGHGGHLGGAVGDGRVRCGEGDVGRRRRVSAGNSISGTDTDTDTDTGIVMVGQDKVGAEVEDVLGAVGLGDLVRGEAGLDGKEGEGGAQDGGRPGQLSKEVDDQLHLDDYAVPADQNNGWWCCAVLGVLNERGIGGNSKAMNVALR